MRSIQARPQGSLMKAATKSKLSKVCVNCRERHVRCTGEPICKRCIEEGGTCFFPPSRQGQRNVHHQLPIHIRSEKAIPGAACTTCRDRHLKCTGEAPCERCRVDRRPCIYQISRRRRQQPGEPIQISESSSLPPSLSQTRDARSARSYQYFRENTARRLSGHYDQELFTSLVLQISQSQDSIWHAVVALGATHEMVDLPRHKQDSHPGQTLHQYALIQCNEAIKCLKPQRVRQPSTEIMILSSILFMHLEYMRNQTESETALLFKGLNIIYGSSSGDTVSQGIESGKSFINQYLAPPLVAAWTDCIERGVHNDPRLPSLQVHGIDADSMYGMLKNPNDTRKQFSSLSEARISLDIDATRIAIAIRDLGFSPPTQDLAKVVSWGQLSLQIWHEHLVCFLDNNYYSQNEGEYRTSVLLRIHYRMAVILLSTVPFRDEARFDMHTEKFQEIVMLCQELRQLDSEGPFNGIGLSKHNGRTSFKSETGVTLPLHLVASRCRDPRVRRDAVQAIYVGSVDNLPASHVNAMIADEIRKMEEKNLGKIRSCTDIPPGNRVFLHKMRYDPGTAMNTSAHNCRGPTLTLEWLKAPFIEYDPESIKTVLPLETDDAEDFGPKPFMVDSSYELQNKLQLKFTRYEG